jgi:YD repeat-containing protein
VTLPAATTAGKTVSRLTRPFLAAILFALGSPAPAQTDPTVFAEQVKLVRAAESLPAQGPTLFGDQVNLYTGALQFAQTDISIPGNSGLPVEVRRTFVTGQAGLLTAYFGDWDLDLPALRGTFAVGTYNGGWVVDTSPTHPDYWKRCTYFAEPPEARPNVGLSRWFGYEYWFGTTLSAPGGGEVLVRGAGNTQQPQDGNAWPLVTRSGWQLRCLSSLHAQNVDAEYARGEGFLALAPDGTSYRFDWLISRDTTSLIKRRSGSVDTLFRRDFLIYPSEVTDRHGNWVRYNFSPTNRKQLLSITASDGRAITFSYDSFDRITSASDGTRTWTYTYSGSNGSANLATVVRPDWSQWKFALNPLRQIVAVEGDAACGSFAVPYASPSTGTITHPSGATGSFTLTTLLHGRKVSTSCDAQKWTFSPKNFGVRSLTSKSVSGPGMPAATWTYQYNAPPGSDPSCTSCPNTKTVSVTDPRGHVTRHTFGIVALANEGQQLQVDEGWTGSGALRTTTYRYRDKSAGPYAAPQGYSPNPRSDSLDSLYHAPLDQRITTQQGSTFTWTASAFDTRARPTSVTRSSSLGHTKSETTAYFDHTGKWVLGQMASVTDSSGAVQESHSYDATTANRTASYAFGLLQESYAYYANGLLNVRYDQAGRPTTYSNYQRGVPQTVTHPDSTTESAVVNALGWVTSITNAAGTTTTYGYDAMGRVASITYPSETGLSYHPTTQVFEQFNSPELGIAAGHWRQTTTTGNARTVRYFDGLWRERVKVTYDTTDSGGTTRAVETRYEAGGFKSFASTPQRSLTSVDGALAGIGWTYDALGRVTLQSQSSELGTLNTTTEYLTGFQKRVTNPRGFQSTRAKTRWPSPGCPKAPPSRSIATCLASQPLSPATATMAASGPAPRAATSTTPTSACARRSSPKAAPPCRRTTAPATWLGAQSAPRSPASRPATRPVCRPTARSPTATTQAIG